MKIVKLIVVGTILLVTTAMHSQISVSVNFGTPPAWGPVGYSSVDYYYLPDVEAYYDIRESQFIYFGNGRWIRSARLPKKYSNYDLYHGYKVVLNDYHGRSPYANFNQHKVTYYRGYKGNPQKVYGKNYSKENRRNENRGNFEHDNGNRGNEHNNNGNHDNGNHGNKGNGHGKH